MLIVCAQCQKRLNLDRMGMWILSVNSLTGKVIAGYRADRYHCPGCNYYCVTDPGLPLTPDNTPNFARVIEAARNEVHVEYEWND